MNRVFIIAEIGINHNGSLENAMALMKAAAEAGCDAVKFQKRTVDVVYSQAFLDSCRESPWGTTQRAQKEGLEFGTEEYCRIDAYSKELGIPWFASAWDADSQIFLRQFDLKYNKIASAMLTDHDFLKLVAQEKRYTFISTGMSTLEEIDAAVRIFEAYGCPFELMHCNSTYPMEDRMANLSLIGQLRQRYSCGVGYSGHEKGILVSYTAAVLGATSVERHLTLDRTMYGSDQKASIEPGELQQLVRDIRKIDEILGDGQKDITPQEAVIRKKLVK